MALLLLGGPHVQVSDIDSDLHKDTHLHQDVHSDVNEDAHLHQDCQGEEDPLMHTYTSSFAWLCLPLRIFNGTSNDLLATRNALTPRAPCAHMKSFKGNFEK